MPVFRRNLVTTGTQNEWLHNILISSKTHHCFNTKKSDIKTTKNFEIFGEVNVHCEKTL